MTENDCHSSECFLGLLKSQGFPVHPVGLNLVYGTAAVSINKPENPVALA